MAQVDTPLYAFVPAWAHVLHLVLVVIIKRERAIRICSGGVWGKEGAHAEASFPPEGLNTHQDSMVWYGMVWYGMVWYGMVWYGMV